MEWNQLQRFLVVAREENISRAAELLDTTQPSLSQGIKRLEEELGYELFAREGKRIRLNESGHIMMQTVKQMDELMQNTRLRLEELNGREHPEVAIHIGTASTLLPQLLLYLRGRSPQIHYQIHQFKPEHAESEDDIQILAGEVGIYREDEVLLIEEIQLALPGNHALAAKEKIFLHDLLSEEFISLNEQWELGREIMKEAHKRLFSPRMTMFVDNPNMMRELLRAHLGIAFVPATSWHDFAGEEIVLRPVEDFSLKRVIYLRTKTRKYLTKEQKECIRGIREFFEAIRQQA